MSPQPSAIDYETIEYRASALPPAVERLPALLSWTDAGGPHQVTVTERVTLGSAAGAGISLFDRAASRIHAEIVPRADGLWIRDLGSRNGTFVGLMQVVEARLPEPCQVRLGSTLIDVSRATQPSVEPLWPIGNYGGMLGNSVAMRDLFVKLDRIASSAAAVLIAAETGSGKELAAHAIHAASPRAGKPFVVVDCAALPESLLESELFGHARGAFSGAATAREGAIEAANGGTVFLDEIGELPLAMQPKLLRAIEARAVRRIGETHYRPVDVRFVSATHRDLRRMVNQQAFREDLYFRLAVLVVTIPPLRERAEDIPLLVAHFADPKQPIALDSTQLARLGAARWSGNVRELRNFVERAGTLGIPHALASIETSDASETDGGRAGTESEAAAMVSPSGGAEEPSLAPVVLSSSGAAGSEMVVGRDTPPLSASVTFREMRDTWTVFLEREYVRRLLAAHGGIVADAAAAAGLDRTYLYKLIRKHGL